MNGVRVLGNAVLFPIRSMAAGAVAVGLVGPSGAGAFVEKIVGLLAFHATLALLYARQWSRGRRTAED